MSVAIFPSGSHGRKGRTASEGEACGCFSHSADFHNAGCMLNPGHWPRLIYRCWSVTVARSLCADRKPKRVYRIKDRDAYCEARKRSGKAGAEAVALKRATDFEFDQRMRETLRANVRAAREAARTLRDNPEYDAWFREVCKQNALNTQR
eukprot:6300667-Pyramimonas_sp.AAC.1